MCHLVNISHHSRGANGFSDMTAQTAAGESEQ